MSGNGTLQTGRTTFPRIATMTKLSLSPLRLFLLGLLGSVIVLAGAVAGVIALWQPRPLEAFLPAENTVALFSHVTREDLRQFTAEFSVLSSIPVFDGIVDAGVIGLPGGQQTWVLSSPSKDAPLPSVNVHIGHQGFLVEKTEIGDLLQSTDGRLRDVSAFADLMRGTDPHARRIYRRTNAAIATDLLPTVLRSLIHASGSLLVSTDGETASIRVHGNMGESLPQIRQEVIQLSPSPDLTVRVSNIAQSMDRLLATTPETDRTITKSIVGKRVKEILGNDWSIEYDILPLLAKESLLAVKSNADAPYSFLLESTTGDSQNLSKRLNAFHDHFRAEHIGTTVTKKTFDKNFASTLLKSDPSQIEDVRQTVNGWTVRETREKNGTHMLVSAVKGSTFVLSTVREWVDQITSGKTPETLPHIGSPIAGGAVSQTLAAILLKNLERDTHWMWLRSALGIDPLRLLWSVEMDDHVLTISLKAAEGNDTR